MRPLASLAPAALRARSLGLYGGSFDPVHAAHLYVARAAQIGFALEHVVWVPAARPPHKPGRELASGAHRAEMLRIALRVEPEWSVWEVELERAGPSYTIDTLRELARARGHAGGLHLIVGSDNLEGLAGWKEAGAVLDLAQPVVVARRASDRELPSQMRALLGPAPCARLDAGYLDVEPLDVSATELRERLARGLDPHELLPPGVYDYIRAHELYGAA